MMFPCLFVLITEKTWHHLICKDFAVFFLEDVVHQTVFWTGQGLLDEYFIWASLMGRLGFFFGEGGGGGGGKE